MTYSCDDHYQLICCYIYWLTHLYDNAVAKSRVAVHLLDLSMNLLQVQRLYLLMNCLSKGRQTFLIEALPRYM